MSKAAVAADILEKFKQAVIEQEDLFEALGRLAMRASVEQRYDRSGRHQLLAIAPCLIVSSSISE